MKITVCSSAFFVKEAYEIKKKLEDKGHIIFIFPQEIKINNEVITVKKYHEMRHNNLTEDLLKIKKELINDHIKKIENSDAILVLNFNKDGKDGYIGGNTFLEMVIAFYLNKKIFLWKEPATDLPYFEEILPLNPIIINGNLEKIK